MNQLNFNSHPELNDKEFVVAALCVFNGQKPKDISAQELTQTLAYLQSLGGGAGGRFAMVQGWIDGGFVGNSDDNWFMNIPSWGWLLVIPVGLVTAAYLAWRAYRNQLTDAIDAGNSHGGGY